MTVRRLPVSVTTDGSGDATVYSGKVSGKLVAIEYVKDDFDNGITVAVTAEATGETLWSEAAVNASAIRRTRAPVHTTAGVALLYAALGTEVEDVIRLGWDRVKIVVSSGGDTTSGTFNVIMED
jgi:hypothetical protein